MLFNRLGLVLLLLSNEIQSKSIYPNRQIAADESVAIRMLGEECQSNDQCRRTPVDGTKICQDNQCQCSIGYIPIDSYRCIQDFVPASILLTSPSMELEESPGYGSLCTNNEDCQYLTGQLECFHGTCVCLEGYVPLGKYLCYDIRGQGAPIMESTTLTSTIQSANFTCLIDDYCREVIPHSYCSNGKCQCLNGYIPLNDRTCLENDRIFISKQSSIERVTTPSMHYRSLLGGECLTNENCQTIDARCVNQICSCPMDSFPIDEWNCLKDSDKSSSHSLRLDSTKMSTSSSFDWWPWTTPSSPTTTTKSIRLSCLFNDQCIHLDPNSHCQSGRCICNTGYDIDLTSILPRCIPTLLHDDTCD